MILLLRVTVYLSVGVFRLVLLKTQEIHLAIPIGNVRNADSESAFPRLIAGMYEVTVLAKSLGMVSLEPAWGCSHIHTSAHTLRCRYRGVEGSV